jgi:hypothetical protein
MAKSKYSGRRRGKARKGSKRSRRVYNKYDQGYAEKIVKFATWNANTSNGRSAIFQVHSVAWYPTSTGPTTIADNSSAPNLAGGTSENQQWTSINEMWSRY